MFATKAFAIASFILAGVKALEVSTPDNVVQVRTAHPFSPASERRLLTA